MPTTNETKEFNESTDDRAESFMETVDNPTLSDVADIRQREEMQEEPEELSGEEETSEPSEIRNLAETRYQFSPEQLDGLNDTQIQAMMRAIDRNVLNGYPQSGFQPGFEPNYAQSGLPNAQQMPYAYGNYPMSQPGNAGQPTMFQQQSQVPGGQPMNQPGMSQQGFQLPPAPSLDRETWDDSIVNAFEAQQKQNEYLAQQLSQMQQTMLQQQQMQQWEYEQELQNYDTQLSALIHNQVNSLGEDYQGVVNTRDAQQINQIKEGIWRLQQHPAYQMASTEELFKIVVDSYFSPQIQNNRNQSLSQKVTLRSAQTIGRPGRKKGENPLRDIRDKETGVSMDTINKVDQEIREMSRQR